MLVTAMHVVLITAYTVVSFLSYNIVENPWTQFKLYTAQTIAGDVLDIFIACMIWFIIDDDAAPNIVRDE